MKLNYKYIFICLVIGYFIFRAKDHLEYFASTSPGTLMQLVAYGAQDIYLTGGDSRPAEPILADQSKIQKTIL